MGGGYAETLVWLDDAPSAGTCAALPGVVIVVAEVRGCRPKAAPHLTLTSRSTHYGDATPRRADAGGATRRRANDAPPSRRRGHATQ